MLEMGGQLGLLSGLVLIVLGLVVAFFGRKLTKIIFFLIGGLVGAFLAPWVLAVLVSPEFIQPPYVYITAAVGFVILGAISLLLMRLGAGILAGLATLMLLKDIIGRDFIGMLITIILALIALVIVIVLFDKILSVVTAFIGSLIFVVGLLWAGILLPSILQLILVIIITVLGSIVQLKT